MQVPVDLPAVCAVACLAGVVNRCAVIQPKRADTGFVKVPNLWAAIVTPPGRLKSPVLHAFTIHLLRIESRWWGEHTLKLEAHAAWEREQRVRERAWEQKSVAAVKRGESPPPFPGNQKPKPSRRRLIANNPTHEALHSILSENPVGVLLVRDELSGFLAALDRPGREGERQFFLETWPGDVPFTIDRIERGTTRAPALCLSIVGGIQPGRLRQYLVDALKGGSGDDGLFQRFQLITWPDFRAWELVDRPPNGEAADRAARVYGRAGRVCAGRAVVLLLRR
jgi:putative DNA primase/helicase